MADLWAMTCSVGSRVQEAIDAFEYADIPVYRRVLVTTQPDPVPHDTEGIGHVVLFDSTEINISKWWDLALNKIEYLALMNLSALNLKSFVEGEAPPEPEWDVMWLPDDIRILPEDTNRVRSAMREHGCVMAGADWKHLLGPGEVHIRRDNSRWNIHGRMPGVCFIVAGEAGIRPDPEFRWWLADDDFEWQHRVNGGTVLVGGADFDHLGEEYALTGDRARYYEEDLVKFREKWNGLPLHGGVIDNG